MLFPNTFLRISLWAALISGTTGTPTFAQARIDAKVDSIVRKVMVDESIPGMAVAVIRDGNVLFQKAYGVRSIQAPARTDRQTVFSIGSVSKAFTAIGIMRLVEERKVMLDDPIKKYMKGLPATWQQITVRQFMTHTSGIPELKGKKSDPDFRKTLAAAGQLPMAFSPGARQQYNNFNFAVMGQFITSVTGMDYLAYMQQQVFRPAGMKNTGILPSDDASTGHLEKKGKLVPVISHFKAGDYGLSSGGLQTTLADFISLSQALAGGRLLQQQTLKDMWTPFSPRLSNTPGWHSRMAGNELVIHKGGGGTGIGSLCDYKIVPSRRLYVVVMINKDKINISPDEITDAILLQCFAIPGGTTGGDEGEGD